MKAKIVLMLLICLLFLNCRSRRKAVQTEKETTHETIKSDTNIVVSAEKEVAEIKQEVKKVEQKEKENSGDIIIKGKTDSSNDFHYHNVVNGDTLSNIIIKGNADFIIKNKWKQTDKKEIIETVSEKLNIVAEFARKSVAQSTIREVAKEVKKVETKISAKSFTFGAWLTYFLLAVVVICAVWLMYYFSGKIDFRKILEQLKRKR